MAYSVEILIGKRESVLDAEAKTIKSALESLGFEGIISLSYKRSISYVTKKRTERVARKQAEKICEGYLSTSVNEDYEIVSITKIRSK